jgi:hypothetical protein
MPIYKALRLLPMGLAQAHVATIFAQPCARLHLVDFLQQLRCAALPRVALHGDDGAPAETPPLPPHATEPRQRRALRTDQWAPTVHVSHRRQQQQQQQRRQGLRTATAATELAWRSALMVTHASGTNVTRKLSSHASRTADSTH